jgi:hypothetical protein
MAYFNFEYAENKGLSPLDVLILQIVKQLKYQPELDNTLAMVVTDEFLYKAYEDGYINTIKGKKGDSELSKHRLTKKGNKLLRDLTSYGKPDEDAEKIAEWLKKLYSKRVTSVKSNQKELQRRIHWFSNETQIYKNYLAALLECFINDTYIEDVNDKRPFNIKFNEFKEENPRGILSSKAENVLWTPPDRFAREYQLENSPLWSYYQDNENYVNNYWKHKGLKIEK